MNLIDQILHLGLLLRDDIRNLGIGRFIRNQVADSNTICVRLHVFRNDILKTIDEVSSGDVSKIITHALNQTHAAATKYGFVNLTAHHPPVPDFNHVV